MKYGILTVVFLAVIFIPAAAGQPMDQEVVIGAKNEVTAVYVDVPPRIDGILDDAIWSSIQPIDRFVQLSPEEGVDPSQKSTMRIAYDENNLYFGFEFLDKEPEKIRARNMQRGGPGNGRDDMMWLLIDTYHDRRNAYLFETNALGTQDDAIINDESMGHDDWQWDGIYTSEGRVSDDGWILEVAIPFRTIRFNKGEEITMGVAVQRFLVRTGEKSIWPYIPRRYSAGIFQVSQYAELKGIENVSRGNNLEIKPYLLTGTQQIGLGGSETSTEVIRDAGVDVKYGITSNITLDATINTDFAQVESDNVQLDLTRFNLFFPEKREFFLERAGLFQLGDAQKTETFFSRRIGITNDILAGARLTGQTGRLSIGALNIQTKANKDLETSDPDYYASNNTVLRLRADVLSRTTIGGIFTNIEQGQWFNRAFGIDAERRFLGNSRIGGWYSRVEDSTPDASDAAGSVFMDIRRADFGVGAAYRSVGTRFNPALGFVRRRNMKEYAGSTFYTPQFGSAGLVKSMSTKLDGSIINGQDNMLQSSSLKFSSSAIFQTTESLELGLGRTFERLDRPFQIRPDAEIPIGDYHSNSLSFGGKTPESRFFSVNAKVALSEYFGGDRRTYSGGLGLRTGRYLNLQAKVTYDAFDIPIENGRFDATTFALTINAAASRKLFANGLIQYDNFSGDVQANIRIDWIHTPGSDLFIVLNTSYNFTGTDDRFDPRNATLNNRAGVAKITYALQI